MASKKMTLADLRGRCNPDCRKYQTDNMVTEEPSEGKPHIDSLFKQAREIGASEGYFEPPEASASKSFPGTGRLLNGEDVSSASHQSQDAIHNITFWTNGFTVNDGALRSYDDPSNVSFLKSIKRGECPKELQPSSTNASVHVNLIKKKKQFNVNTTKSPKFEGNGRLLANSRSLKFSSTASSESSNAGADTYVVVDKSKPFTTIILRLADGTRVTLCLNNDHIVRDIRTIIDFSKPNSRRSYDLQVMGFPPRPLNNLEETIESAELMNSTIIQKPR